MNRKLILFDIDGTLIYHVASHRYQDQYEEALQKIFDVNIPFEIGKYNGKLERFIAWDIVKQYGIARSVFLEKFPLYIDAMHAFLRIRSSRRQLFLPIVNAFALVKRLSREKGITLGIITGNAKRIAEWKLSHTGYSQYFHFGLYGDEADDRNALAAKVFHKARKELGISYKPADITVVGDTVHDIRCGKAIGGYTIAVTTGMHGPRAKLAAEHPDLIVDSLTEKAVLALFSLK